MAALAAAGCTCAGRADPTPADRPARAAPAPTADAAAPHPLAGRWSGRATAPGYGAVAGEAEIDRHGRGSGVVSARGLTLAAALVVRSWDGRWLEVTVDGVPYSFRASVRGDALDLELPVVGPVKLTRRASR
jgi:hypothetical protein